MTSPIHIFRFSFMLLCLNATAMAAVLPEDRTDLMYHRYEGGGVTVSGPALLVRKSAGDSLSFTGRYYVDSVSSASIDVITTASPYHDTREEFSVGVDYLRNNSLMSFSATSGKETDYLADSYNLNVAHELFGGLTTVSTGFSQGQDIVMRSDNAFEADINRYSYRIGVSQVLTRSMLLGVSYEGVSEEGQLSNPYRSARLLGASLPERYPGTRDSQALAIRLVKGLAIGDRPVGHSIRAEYRYFRDNWNIHSNTLRLVFQHHFSDRWLGEFRYRYYQQSAASFYSDNFDGEMAYMARDKELSTFSSHSLGTRWSWMFAKQRFLFIDRASLNFSLDHLRFNYDDFSDVRTGQPYSFGANILQLYISAWY